MKDPGRDHWGWRLAGGGPIAGTLIGLWDLFARPIVLNRGTVPAPDLLTAMYVLGVATLGGSLFGLALAILVGIARGLACRRRLTPANPGVLVVAIALVLGFEFLNRTTFDGPRIAAHPRIGLIRIGFHVILALTCLLGTWAVARVARGASGWRRGARNAGGAALIALAVVPYAVDATQLVGHYPDIHLQIAVVTMSVILLGAALASFRQRRWLWAVFSIWIAVVPVLRRTTDVRGARAWMERATVQVRQWASIPETLFDRIAPMAAADVADVTNIVAAGGPSHRSEVDESLNRLVPDRTGMNLLVVSVDTLRADHTGFMGYRGHPTTPVLDRLAADSIVFNRCYSSYPTSSYSYSAFFTGRYPSCAPVAWAGQTDEPKWPDDLTLAGALRAAGARTIAESAFNRETLGDRKVFGHLRDGFEIVNRDAPITARNAEGVTRASIRWIEHLADRRFFLWVHYLDVHEPYGSHPEFDFGDRPIDRYDSETAWVDQRIGRILERLEQLGIRDRTVVVVMSDHGDEFGEHMSRYHNTSVYEEQIRVPLILHVPGIKSRRIDNVVSLVDVMPTLLHLFGLRDSHRRNGRDRWPEILGLAAGKNNYVYAELHPPRRVLGGGKRMIVHRHLKLIQNLRSRTEEVYDLAADPHETRNLLGTVGDEEGILRGLMKSVRREIESIRAEHGAAPAADPLAEILKRMDAVESLPPATRRKKLSALVYDILDPVFRVKDPYTDFLTEPLRGRALRFAEKVFDQRDPLLALPALRLLNAIEDPAATPFLKTIDTNHPLIRTEAAVTRGVVGDASVRDELRAILEYDGSPGRQAIAVSLLMLGDPVGLDHVLALLRTSAPIHGARAIEALGRMRHPALLRIAEEMIDHVNWRYAPMRLALAEALRGYPPSAVRTRLLARLAADYEPKVVRTARETLRREIEPKARKALLVRGEREAEADDAILHRRFVEAADYLDEALAASSDLHPILVLKRARIEQFFGGGSRAAAIVRGVLKQYPDAVSEDRRRVSAWLDGLRVTSRQLLEQRRVSVIEATSGATTMPRQWCLLTARVRNDGQTPWLGGRIGARFCFEVVLRDERGKDIVESPSWTPDVGLDDVAPGAVLRLLLPFTAPRAPGRYRIGLRAVTQLPNLQWVRPAPAVDTGRVIEVVRDIRLRGSGR